MAIETGTHCSGNAKDRRPAFRFELARTQAAQKIATHTRNTLVAAFAACLTLLTFVLFPARADGINSDATAWQLIQPIGWDNKDPRGVQNGSILIDDIAANSTGGYIRITAKGSGRNGPCPGHAQRFRLTWRFDRDVTRIGGHPGDIVVGTAAALEGDKDNCLNANPYWTVEEWGELLGTKPGGWGFHYFNDPPGTLPGIMTLSVRIPNRTREGFCIQFAAGWPWPFDLRVLYLYNALPSGTSPGPQLKPAATTYTETGQSFQSEVRDARGRITVEAATIHHIQCYVGGTPGRAVLIYEYRNRNAFRAIQPPNWSVVLGGHEFSSFAAAADAACGLHR